MTTDTTHPCPTCRGIRTLISQKFCKACGESLLELPTAAPTATDADAKKATRELEYWRCEARNWRDVAEKLQQQADAKANTGTACGKSTTVNTAESFTTVQMPHLAAGFWIRLHSSTTGATETFTSAQMLEAVDQWLAFGERMMAVNQHSGHFAYSGWAARALREVRRIVESVEQNGNEGR